MILYKMLKFKFLLIKNSIIVWFFFTILRIMSIFSIFTIFRYYYFRIIRIIFSSVTIFKTFRFRFTRTFRRIRIRSLSSSFFIWIWTLLWVFSLINFYIKKYLPLSFSISHFMTWFFTNKTFSNQIIFIKLCAKSSNMTFFFTLKA